MFDGKAFGEDIVGIVKGYCEREIAPLRAENIELKSRIAGLESRPAHDDVFILELVQNEIAKIPPPENGKDADPEQVASLVAEQVKEAVAALPAPQDGKSIGVEDVAPLIVEEVAKIAPDMAEIREAIAAEVSKAVAEIPIPKDGKDAAGIVEALKDSGELVLTLQDGRLVRTGIRDGEKGKDGRDGFGFDDMDVAVLEDDRTIELSFRRGDEEKVFTLKWPTTLDRGVFNVDQEYEAGDGVTWGGQFYIANEPSKGMKPDQAKDGKPWRLAVRKGRDGKDKTKE
jgi:hypothetical protein